MFESPCSLVPYSNPVLRLCAKRWCYKRTLACFDRLVITSLALNGCGINSVQINQPVGIFIINVINLGWRASTIVSVLAYKVLLMGSSLMTCEGCLSIKSLFKRVYRRKRVTIIYFDVLNARIRAFKTSNLLAICCQHEANHNDGKLIIDDCVE
ncbi:Peptide deformylase [Candidatus Hodgkinia cicadicola]|nr:Peptide deformylase [Candidatus Hodgkinia cicadicola]